MNHKIFVALSTFSQFSQSPLKLLKKSGYSHSINPLGRRLVREEIIEMGQKSEGIIAGDDFSAVAVAVSDDPGSAVEGGDLGWTGPGAFVGEFEAALNSLEIGEISEPFESPFGWHIVEVLERRVHDTTEDIQRQRAMMAIRESKVEEETELWLRQIRDEAFVEYRM